MRRMIDILEDEHRLIKLVLESLITFADSVGEGDSGARAHLGEYTVFFRNFADKYHHGKEEEMLFHEMQRYGFSKEQGPLAVMFIEHDEGRRLVSALADIAQRNAPWSSDEIGEVKSAATALFSLLGSHIYKEDNILYPMALQTLPAGELERLSEDCDIFAERWSGIGYSEMTAMAGRLIEKYPPDPAKTSRIQSCTGCAAHG
ncbi:MAG: hemerythrin domain-containing protein [Verrucomicrobia bacterium]|nr:hemerythrin domain-containing protein [Verrucomicrobiota bacterium]MCF7707570.1 hemerythrin domain-containing protein [Verrucomicrobiota bacterium]